MIPLGMSVLTAARERIAFAYDHYDRVVVSFSGGKDSTVVLNLTLDAARARDDLPLEVLFVDEEGISYQTEDYVRRVSRLPDVNLHWLALPVRHRSAVSSEQGWWFPWAPEDESKWVRPMPSEAIHVGNCDWYTDPAVEDRPTVPDLMKIFTATHYKGRTAMLLGIRADESLVRRRSVSSDRKENYVVPMNADADKVLPIYDWSTQDVWTAPATFGWDHNETYDHLEMAGLPPSRQRCAPPFGDEPMGDLWMWAACFPEIWERLSQRVPGAATAARYSRTELYAFGTLPKKPEGVGWMEFVRDLLSRENDLTQRTLKARAVSRLLQMHRNKTIDPMLHASHPESGIGWRDVIKVAVRGDLKNRSLASLSYGDVNRSYTNELAQWMAENPAAASALGQRHRARSSTAPKVIIEGGVSAAESRRIARALADELIKESLHAGA